MLPLKYIVLIAALLIAVDARGQLRRYDDHPEDDTKTYDDPRLIWRMLAAEKGLKGVIVEGIDSAKVDTQKVVGYETVGKNLRETYVRNGRKYLRDSIVSDFDSLGRLVRTETNDFISRRIYLYEYRSDFLSKKYRYDPAYNDLTFTSYSAGPDGRFRRIENHDANGDGRDYRIRVFIKNKLLSERKWSRPDDNRTTYLYEYDSLGRRTQTVIEQDDTAASNSRWSLSHFNTRLKFKDSAHLEYKFEYAYDSKLKKWDTSSSFITVTDSVRNLSVEFALDSAGRIRWVDSTHKNARHQPLRKVILRFYDNEVDRTETLWEYGSYDEVLAEKKKYASGKIVSTIYHYLWK